MQAPTESPRDTSPANEKAVEFLYEEMRHVLCDSIYYGYRVKEIKQRLVISEVVAALSATAAVATVIDTVGWLKTGLGVVVAVISVVMASLGWSRDLARYEHLHLSYGSLFSDFMGLIRDIQCVGMFTATHAEVARYLRSQANRVRMIDEVPQDCKLREKSVTEADELIPKERFCSTPHEQRQVSSSATSSSAPSQ